MKSVHLEKIQNGISRILPAEAYVSGSELVVWMHAWGLEATIMGHVSEVLCGHHGCFRFAVEIDDDEVPALLMVFCIKDLKSDFCG